MKIGRTCLCEKRIDETAKKYDENYSLRQSIYRQSLVLTGLKDQISRLQESIEKPKESKYEDIKKFIEELLYSVEKSQRDASHPNLRDDYKDFLNRLDGYESAYKNVLSFIKES